MRTYDTYSVFIYLPKRDCQVLSTFTRVNTSTYISNDYSWNWSIRGGRVGMKQISTETDCARSIRCSVVMIRTTYLIGGFKPLFVNVWESRNVRREYVVTQACIEKMNFLDKLDILQLAHLNILPTTYYYIHPTFVIYLVTIHICTMLPDLHPYHITATN